MMTWTEWVRMILRNDEEDLKELLADLDFLIEVERRLLHQGYADSDLLKEEVKMVDPKELKIRIKEIADIIRQQFPEGLPPRVQ